MRITLVICLALMFAATGCASFPGEWIEQGTMQTDGTIKPVEGERRAALHFMWPSTVRYGAYDNLARAVDHQVVQSDTYFTMQWGKVAQFGAFKARVKGDTLHAYLGGDTTIQFKRVKGPSIFPPMVIVPSLAKAPPPLPQREVIYASIEAPQVDLPQMNTDEH